MIDITSDELDRIEMDLITSMSKFQENVSSGSESDETSKLSKEPGVKTRGQREAMENKGRKMKREVMQLQKECEKFTGQKVESGLGARSIFSDDEELWRYYNSWEKPWWEDEVQKRVKKLRESYLETLETAFYSADVEKTGRRKEEMARRSCKGV